MILASRAHCAFRRFGIFCALVPAATLFPLKAEGQATPGEARLPNVLILLADDLTYLLNGIDMPGVRTPNLDRLAAEGVRFTRAAANHPVCTTSRATLMTGLYAPIHGSWINNLALDSPNTTYLPEVFQRSGYATGFSGKWHLDGGIDRTTGGPGIDFRPRDQSYVPADRRRGFEEWLGYEFGTIHNAPFFWDDIALPPVFRNVPEFGWEMRFQRAALRDFVSRESRNNRPWMYKVSIGLPHGPNQAPAEFKAMYDPATIELPPWIPSGLTSSQSFHARHTVAIMYAMVSFMDAEIGNMLSDLRAAGQLDNTLVVFTADHGDLLGSHWDRWNFETYYFRGKDTPYSNSFRIPLIMRWPEKIPPRTEVDALIGMVDVPPTILSLAGLPVPWRMQGVDMSGWAQGGTGPDRAGIWLHLQKIFSHPTWYAVWTGDHVYSAGQLRALYDLRTDPYEFQDLIDTPEAAVLQQELHALLDSLTAEALTPPSVPNLFAMSSDVSSGLQLAVTQSDEKALVDGVPIRGYVELALAIGRGQGNDPALRDALLNAFARNLEHFDRNDLIRTRRMRAVVALAMCSSPSVQQRVSRRLYERLGLELRGQYERVTCTEEGCFPDDPHAGSTLPGVAPFIEPLAGYGDADGDGFSNAEEYANALATGTGIEGFVRAALDPELGGREVRAGSDGHCFIATAAYGTPLAHELDRLRVVRDSYLLASSGGSVAADLYYRLSPPAANWIAVHPPARAAVRSGLVFLQIPGLKWCGLLLILALSGAMFWNASRAVRLLRPR